MPRSSKRKSAPSTRAKEAKQAEQVLAKSKRSRSSKSPPKNKSPPTHVASRKGQPTAAKGKKGQREPQGEEKEEQFSVRNTYLRVYADDKKKRTSVSLPGQEHEFLMNRVRNTAFFETELTYGSSFEDLKEAIRDIFEECDCDVEFDLQRLQSGAFIFRREARQTSREVTSRSNKTVAITSAKRWNDAMQQCAYLEPVSCEDDRSGGDASSASTTTPVTIARAFLDLCVLVTSGVAKTSKIAGGIRDCRIQIYLLGPTRTTSPEKREYSIENPDNWDENPIVLEPQWNARFVEIRNAILAAATASALYQDKKNNNTHMVGKLSGVFHKTTRGHIRVMQQLRNTADLENYFEDQRQKQKRDREKRRDDTEEEDDTETVVVYLSIGAKKEDGGSYDINDNLPPSSQDLIFSTPQTKIKPQSGQLQRLDETEASTRAQQFVMKCFRYDNCELYHAFTKEHYVYYTHRVKVTRFDGQFAWEKWPCNEREPSSWPKLDDLPPDLTPLTCKTESFFGKKPKTGEYPPVDGDLQSFARNEPGRNVSWQATLADAVGAMMSRLPPTTPTVPPTPAMQATPTLLPAPPLASLSAPATIYLTFSNQISGDFFSTIQPIGPTSMSTILRLEKCKTSKVLSISRKMKEEIKRGKKQVQFVVTVPSTSRSIPFTMEQFKEITVQDISQIRNEGHVEIKIQVVDRAIPSDDLSDLSD